MPSLRPRIASAVSAPPAKSAPPKPNQPRRTKSAPKGPKPRLQPSKPAKPTREASIDSACTVLSFPDNRDDDLNPMALQTRDLLYDYLRSIPGLTELSIDEVHLHQTHAPLGLSLPYTWQTHASFRLPRKNGRAIPLSRLPPRLHTILRQALKSGTLTATFNPHPPLHAPIPEKKARRDLTEMFIYDDYGTDSEAEDPAHDSEDGEEGEREADKVAVWAALRGEPIVGAFETQEDRRGLARGLGVRCGGEMCQVHGLAVVIESPEVELREKRSQRRNEVEVEEVQAESIRAQSEPVREDSEVDQEWVAKQLEVEAGSRKRLSDFGAPGGEKRMKFGIAVVIDNRGIKRSDFEVQIDTTSSKDTNTTNTNMDVDNADETTLDQQVVHDSQGSEENMEDETMWDPEVVTQLQSSQPSSQPANVVFEHHYEGAEDEMMWDPEIVSSQQLPTTPILRSDTVEEAPRKRRLSTHSRRSKSRPRKETRKENIVGQVQQVEPDQMEDVEMAIQQQLIPVQPVLNHSKLPITNSALQDVSNGREKGATKTPSKGGKDTENKEQLGWSSSVVDFLSSQILSPQRPKSSPAINSSDHNGNAQDEEPAPMWPPKVVNNLTTVLISPQRQRASRHSQPLPLNDTEQEPETDKTTEPETHGNQLLWPSQSLDILSSQLLSPQRPKPPAITPHTTRTSQLNDRDHGSMWDPEVVPSHKPPPQFRQRTLFQTKLFKTPTSTQNSETALQLTPLVTTPATGSSSPPPSHQPPSSPPLSKAPFSRPQTTKPGTTQPEPSKPAATEPQPPTKTPTTTTKPPGSNKENQPPSLMRNLIGRVWNTPKRLCNFEVQVLKTTPKMVVEDSEEEIGDVIVVSSPSKL